MKDYVCGVCGAVVSRIESLQDRDIRRGHVVSCSVKCRGIRRRGKFGGKIGGRKAAVDLVARLMNMTSPEPNSGCWLWLGSVSNGGYGKAMIANRKTGYVHRVLYERLVGPVPAGLELDHLCRVRCCVNPAHLEPVTRIVNQRRGIRWPNSPLRMGGSLAV